MMPAPDAQDQPMRGEAERFTKVLAEAHKSNGSFQRRLLLETLAELLPRFERKLIVAPGQDLDLSVFGDGTARPASANEPRRDGAADRSE
jgi:membrane protease subunit HflK